jgi:hypothetical protein
MAQGHVEMSLYHLQRYFDEFIMPSIGIRLPGLLAVKKTEFTFLQGILQSVEDASLSLVHHCFIWQHLLCNLEQKM